MPMNLRPSLRSARLLVAGAALLAVTAACDSIAGMFGAYTGPPPARDALSSEVVKVAGTYTSPNGAITFHLDRTRFVEAGDPHNVNRVIVAHTTAENQESVTFLHLRAGDHARISTEFSHVAEAGGDMHVQNWPGHDALEYPVGAHRITSIERVVP